MTVGKGSTVSFLLIAILLGAIYSNTLNASWHLDDEPNILNNNRVHLNQISYRGVIDSLRAHPLSTGKLYRPVAMLTFALNWRLCKNSVVGYHVVNFAIHLSCCLLLFLTIARLFECPNIVGYDRRDSHFIALLSAVLWAAHPIQTQAVTYIVQRMASLSTLFFLLALYLYVGARIEGCLKKVWWKYVFSFICFLLAFGSKENTLIFPLSLILAEAVFFQDLSIKKNKNFFSVIGLSVVFTVALVGILLFIGNFSSLLGGYKARSFTLSQRLMTEPRILIYYLSQLFYPVESRLSIEHDIVISTSFFDPWVTPASLMLIGILILWAFFNIRTFPFISFAILFFFLNHSVESTFIPLELIFEHRNYLPSLFLFVPIAIGFNKLICHYHRRKHHPMELFIYLSISLLIVFMGIGTYKRNMVWASDWALWYDASRKSPNSARPAYLLARHYAKRGANVQAMALYEKALRSQSATPDYTRALVLNGMAAIYFAQKNYDESIATFKKAIALKPEFSQIQTNMVTSLIKMGRLSEADRCLENLSEKQSSLYHYLKGLVLSRKRALSSALSHFQHALVLEPDSKIVKIKISETLAAIGYYRQAEIFTRISEPYYDSDIETLAFLYINSIKADRLKQAEFYLDQIFKNTNLTLALGKLREKCEERLMTLRQKTISQNLIYIRIEAFSEKIYAIDQKFKRN